MAEQITLDPVEVSEGAPFPPSVRAVGTVANGTGNITPGLPAGTAEYDILLMPVETAAQAVNVPAGWAHVTGSPVTEGANTRLSVLWKRASSSESAPTLTDPGDHQVARIVGVQDAVRAGYPFEAETTGTEATSDTSASIPGNTTSLNGPNRLVFAALATGASVASTAQAASWANANATTVTERVDNWVTDGNGGGIAAATFTVEYGMRLYPATTVTLSTASSKALMSLAVKPNSRKQLELNTAPLRVLAEGVDWGDAAIQAYLAEQQVGSVQVDFRVPNREVTIPLAVRESSQAAAQSVLQSVAAKVATIQTEGGGWLKREWGSGRKVYLDVLNVSLHTPDKYSHFGFETDMVLKLEAVPEFYGDEIALSDHAETSLPELTFTETVEGDYPARLRLVVDNDQATDQRGLLVATRYYDANAPIAVAQSTMTLLDESARVAGTGSSEAQVIQHNELETSWTPIARIDGYHQGTCRVFVRAWASQVDAFASINHVQLVWGVGDVLKPLSNTPVAYARFFAAGSYTILDLGEIRLPTPDLGRHRWTGIIRAAVVPTYSGVIAANPDIQIDRAWVVPADYGFVRLEADEPSAPTGSLNAHSDFAQLSSGAVTGQALERGGTWQGSGDANDFTASAAFPYVIRRSATADTGFSTGRQLTAGTTAYAGVGVAGIFLWDVAPTGGESITMGLIARWLDANNFWAYTLNVESASGTSNISVDYVTTGSPLVQDRVNIPTPQAGSLYALAWTIDVQGRWTAKFDQASQGGYWEAQTTMMKGQHATLVTGNANDDGRIGILDYFPGSQSIERRCGLFWSWPYTSDAVAYASRSVELGPDGTYRQDAAGQYNAKIPSPATLRAPVSGLERRPVEFFVKGSRGLLDGTEPDSGIDDISTRAYYRPCWLQVAGQ